MPNGKLRKATLKKAKCGFTLVELLVVLAIVALLLTIASPKYFTSIDRAKEATLKQDLNIMRDAIDKFYADNGKYPDDLEQLVEKQYINKVPVDPITDSHETWALITPEPPDEGEMYDVKSGSEAKAMDGSNFADW